MEIAAHLIASVGYLYLAGANLNGSARWAQLLILSFIIGAASAMTIAPYAHAEAALSSQHEAVSRTAGFGFGAGWLLAAWVFALPAGTGWSALSLLHWVAPIAAALELICLFVILIRLAKNLPVSRPTKAPDHLDAAAHFAILGCAMACTSVALLAGESARFTAAMLSALIGSLAIVVVITMKLAGGKNDSRRALVGLGLTVLGLVGSMGVYYTSSRLLCGAMTTLMAIGCGLFQATRSANQTSRINTLAWIVGPLISSSLYYFHLRTSLLLPALVIAAAATGIGSRKRYQQSVVVPTAALCRAEV